MSVDLSRHELIARQLTGPLDALQTASDIVFENYIAWKIELPQPDSDELFARIATDLEILATRQQQSEAKS